MKSFRRAFTIVELLIVVGIIALLISILLPVIYRARQYAQLIQCASNLRQWGIALQEYSDESGGVLPLPVPAGTQTQYFGPSPANAIPGFPKGIDDSSIYFNGVAAFLGKSYYQMLLDDARGILPLPRTGGNNMFTCPGSNAPLASGISGDQLYPGSPDYFALWGTDSTGQLLSKTTPQLFKFDIDYCYNDHLVQAPAPTLAVPNPSPINKVKMCNIRHPACVVALCERISYRGEYLDATVQNWAQNNGFLGGLIQYGYGYTGPIATAKANWSNFAARHLGGGNILFIDGHVGYYKWTDVQLTNKPYPVPATAPVPEYGDYYNANTSQLIWCPWGPCN